MKSSKLLIPLLKFLLMVLTGGKDNKRGKQISDNFCFIIKQNFSGNLINSKISQLLTGDYHPLVQKLPIPSFYNSSIYYSKRRHSIFSGS